MASRTQKQFSDVLVGLLSVRTRALKASIWPIAGRPTKLTNRELSRSLSKLHELVVVALLRSRLIKNLLNDKDAYTKKQWHIKRGKGRGYKAKIKSFKTWYGHHISHDNCVYEIWGNSRSLYVGRTLHGKNRPTDHFVKAWFAQATRIDVFGFQRRRDVPRFECLLTHRDKPAHAYNKPATHRYYSRCPICERLKMASAEVKAIFR